MRCRRAPAQRSAFRAESWSYVRAGGQAGAQRCRAVPDESAAAHNVAIAASARGYGAARPGEAQRLSVGEPALASTSASVQAPIQAQPAWGGPLTLFLIAAQALTITGALVGGHLARRRRFELEAVNKKLREVVQELRKKQEEALVCEADSAEGLLAYRKALETSMASPSAAHPAETYGEGLSLAATRRKVSTLLMDATGCVNANRAADALVACSEALDLADQLADKRAKRAVLRVQAKAHVRAGALAEAVKCLDSALECSEELQEHTGDVDTLGALADVYADLGQLEKALALYDRVIEAIKEEDESASDSSWDC